MKREHYGTTIVSCYVGLITQAINNNFAPLLFLTFQTTYDLPLSLITLLITFDFLIQLTVDLLGAAFVDRIGYRPCIVAAHVLSAVGLAGLGIFPQLLPPYAGLLLAVSIYSVGGGLLEVLVSPIMEACPTENKEAAMSLLHSFYGWGSVAVIALSTLLFRVLGMKNWMWVGLIWALIPACNAVSFAKVPIAPIVPEGEGLRFRELFQEKIFWSLALLMICAGASELSMAQWASAFAESGLHVSKTVGDLAGPCFFAALLGISRVIHARLADRISLRTYMTVSAILCGCSFVLAVLPIHPLWNLLGCGLCGFAVGVMWPGSFSIASKVCPRGGTAMFGLLALFGDVGCTLGPTMVGMVSEFFGDQLKAGLISAILFPTLMILVLWHMPGNGNKALS